MLSDSNGQSSVKNLEGKVAVITGAGSGIGRSIAHLAANRGMRLALSDYDADALRSCVNEISMSPENLVTAAFDVADATAMDNFAAKTAEELGNANLLFNNAGVGGGGVLWEVSEQEWEHVLGVNLLGVINGVRAFTPLIINSGEGHIVNTASIAGLMSAPGTSTYTVSKHAVVALSEVLIGDLKKSGADVGVSVLCPSFVSTRIFESSRHTQHLEKTAEQIEQEQAVEAMSAEFFKTALSPDRVAEYVFEAIENDEFYILTHPKGSRVQVEKRMRDILDNRQPSVSGPEEFPLD